jgi:carboxyl-terminal processing protease
MSSDRPGDPMTVDPLEMDLFRGETHLSERDLSKSLSNGAARGDERPWVTLRCNLPETEREELRELGSEQDDFRLDFPVRFARDLVAQLPRARRQDQLAAGERRFIAPRRGVGLPAPKAACGAVAPAMATIPR